MVACVAAPGQPKEAPSIEAPAQHLSEHAGAEAVARSVRADPHADLRLAGLERSFPEVEAGAAERARLGGIEDRQREVFADQIVRVQSTHDLLRLELALVAARPRDPRREMLEGRDRGFRERAAVARSPRANHEPIRLRALRCQERHACCFRERPSARSAPSIVAKTELLHLRLKALAADLQKPRGVRHVPAGLLEGALDQLPLEA